MVTVTKDPTELDKDLIFSGCFFLIYNSSRKGAVMADK